MSFTIDNIEVTGESIRNAIIYFCNKTTDERGRTINRKPTFITQVENQKLYYYFLLFGIRISSCDTSLPDDIMGGIRFVPNRWTSGGSWELEVANASLDPSPLYLQPPVNKVNGRCPLVNIPMPNGRNYSVQTTNCNDGIWSGVGTNPFTNKCCVLFDAQARNEGGAAWIAPGQYLYYYYGDFKGEPAFAPAKGGVVTYRWAPSRPGETFNPNKVVRETTNQSTLIHRTWFKDRLFNDSAGCQVIPASESLLKLAYWAKKHNSMGYPKNYQYTLMNKEDFTTANAPKPTTFNWYSLFNF